jgi:hypothetical protein
VTLSGRSVEPVIPIFVKCLENLPNIHTIQIYALVGEQLFEGRPLPTVRTAILPDNAHQILRMCPEVRKVICNEGHGYELVSAIATGCKHVEVLEGIIFPSCFHLHEKSIIVGRTSTLTCKIWRSPSPH